MGVFHSFPHLSDRQEKPPLLSVQTFIESPGGSTLTCHSIYFLSRGGARKKARDAILSAYLVKYFSGLVLELLVLHLTDLGEEKSCAVPDGYILSQAFSLDFILIVAYRNPFVIIVSCVSI